MGLPISMEEKHVYELGSPAGTARVTGAVLDGGAGAELAGSEFTRPGTAGVHYP